MFFLQPVTKHAQLLSTTFKESATLSKRMAITALLSALATVLQASGGLIPIVGLFISPLSTAPILLCTLLMVRYGFFSYLLTIVLLLMIQPSEVIVFPFTTGLIGIGLGLSFHLWNRRLSIILIGTLGLLSGILFLLLVIHFPVLGPTVTPNIQILLPLFLFAFVYCWIWVELTVILSKKLFSHHTPNDSGL